MYNRIFVIAAYSPPGKSAVAHLGGSKKIESIISVLHRLNKRVVLINTAHNAESLSNCSVKREVIAGNKVITVTPFTISNRKVGKLLNLIFAVWYALRFRKSTKRFLLWCYNGYAFECLFALLMPKHNDVVIEMEDMPFSRKKGIFDIKNKLDSFLLTRLSKSVQLITCVNSGIADYFSSVPANKVLFPSIITRQLSGQNFNPAFCSSKRVLGYFGGLNEEKGADIILELLADLPLGWQVVVTGSGSLAEKFASLSKAIPEKLTFGHNVSETELYELMKRCDVLVNPHKPIGNMGNGIFPFKVYEYLYTRRLVLTTELPKEIPTIESALVFFEGSATSLKEKLVEAEQLYLKKELAIDNAANFIAENFSEQGFSQTISTILTKSY
jgi:glycosyltransferase involved in cell wall biosynthesis